MRKIIALLLISLFFLTSCGRQETTETQDIDNRAHYKKAKKYYATYGLHGVVNLRQTDRELEWILKKYRETLGELELAIFETTGESREEVMNMIEECNDNIELIREHLASREVKRLEYQRGFVREPRRKSTWTLEEMRAAGMVGIGSTQNQAIADSKAEIERKRSVIGAE